MLAFILAPILSMSEASIVRRNISALSLRSSLLQPLRPSEHLEAARRLGDHVRRAPYLHDPNVGT